MPDSTRQILFFCKMYYNIVIVKDETKILIPLLGVILLMGGLVVLKKFNKIQAPVDIKNSSSGFDLNPVSTTAPVVKEDPNKVKDERKRQEEETKKFIASYGPCRFIPVMMYHHIDDKPGGLYVSKDYFSKQMDYLSQKGYTTVTISDIVDSLVRGKPLPSKPVVITFDDGYLDVYTNAYPVLKQKNFKATIFLPTQLLGGGDYMTWDQVKEMVNSDLITAGDHTLSHKTVYSLDEIQMKDEILSAKNIIEQNTGRAVNVFAYPYGNFNSEAESILQSGGFVGAVTTNRGLACAKLPYELPRVRIGNAVLSAFGL